MTAVRAPAPVGSIVYSCRLVDLGDRLI